MFASVMRLDKVSKLGRRLMQRNRTGLACSFYLVLFMLMLFEGSAHTGCDLLTTDTCLQPCIHVCSNVLKPQLRERLRNSTRETEGDKVREGARKKLRSRKRKREQGRDREGSSEYWERGSKRGNE